LIPIANLTRLDNDPRGVLLQIDGVSYKFKPGTTHSTQRRFVGYIAQQIESVVPSAVQLIDGILHVDYESLIPYLSESIKQNFNDIDDIKSEQHRIKVIVDMLFDDFIQRERRSTQSAEVISHSTPATTQRTMLWRRVIFVLLGITFTVLAVMIGLYFVGQNQPSNDTVNSTPTPVSITPTSAPITPLPTTAPSSTVDNERQALIDLYIATRGENWHIQQLSPDRSPWLSNDTICNWAGVTCSHNRVIQLSLPTCELVGTIPQSIGNLEALNYLDLSQNEISGTLPESIGNLKLLNDLILSENKISGSLPESIGNLKSLNKLDLYENKISGILPESLGNLKSLNKMDLSNNQISGAIPKSITTLNALMWLSLAKNKLTGTIAESINNMEALGHIDLSRNNLTGTIPTSIAQMKSLKTIFLQFNQNLSGTLPDFPKTLAGISVAECNLTGTIPQSLTILPGLLILEMYGNQLHGTIPYLSSSLAAIRLSQNQLEGTLPPISSSYPMDLDVSNNFLNGTIDNLRGVIFGSLILNDNMFTGEVSIDTSIIWSLYLDNNQFTSFDSSVPEPNELRCRADRNPFQCPIPAWFSNYCKATCQ
jgi:Leucine-rich repeat (LRR) protein